MPSFISEVQYAVLSGQGVESGDDAARDSSQEAGYYSYHMYMTLICLYLFQRCNMQFCQAKESNQATMQRETLLKELAAAFDGYNELKGNLEEGTKVSILE